MDSYIIRWNDKLTIDNGDIDEQHKKLIQLIENLPDKPTPRDGIILKEALDYAGTHFQQEEAFMEKIGYPDLKEHQRIHKTLTRILLKYNKEYENGERDLYSFKHFMFRWVRDHIMDEDRKIRVFLESKT